MSVLHRISLAMLLVMALAIPASADQEIPFDYYLEVARGNVTHAYGVNKFGSATNCDNGIATDIWDGANATTDQDIWVAPTVARAHVIASSHADDDVTGAGMRTVRIYGLPDWDTAEVSEVITLDGTTDVTTTNSYVIIYRMRGLTYGANETNTGYITATAVTDGTLTAQINPGNGQTQMMIFGIPSTQYMVFTHITAGLLKATGASTLADIDILVKDNPDDADSGWRVVSTFAMSTNARLDRIYTIPWKFEGPLIVKMQATSSADNATITATGAGIVYDT